MSRPRRFAAVDNDAIDGLPSILSIGLLTRLIRAKDGDDVTVETLSNDYDEGEKSLTKAMRALVEDAYVVKFKVQRATTEIVIEDGKEVVKRAGLGTPRSRWTRSRSARSTSRRWWRRSTPRECEVAPRGAGAVGPGKWVGAASDRPAPLKCVSVRPAETHLRATRETEK
ncbi:hypothetical protein [Streptomyces microflavus]|uniref:hypothetical protein n=1 Tax=Streptomyces microflavus TaxID=1919 RepID=UPI003B2284FE